MGGIFSQEDLYSAINNLGDEMNVQNLIVQLTNEAILITILISLPAIIASLGVGLSVALFSATTQIQEQTLSFAPKMVFVYVALAAAGAWMGSILMRFTIQCMTEFIAVV